MQNLLNILFEDTTESSKAMEILSIAADIITKHEGKDETTDKAFTSIAKRNLRRFFKTGKCKFLFEDKDEEGNWVCYDIYGNDMWCEPRSLGQYMFDLWNGNIYRWNGLAWHDETLGLSCNPSVKVKWNIEER